MGEPASPEQLKAAPTDDQNTVKQQHVPTPATEQNEAVNEAEKTHDEAEKVGDETESKDSKPVENIEEQAVNGGKESGGEKVHGDSNFRIRIILKLINTVNTKFHTQYKILFSF